MYLKVGKDLFFYSLITYHCLKKKKKIKVTTGLVLLIRENLNLDQYLSMNALYGSDTAIAYTLLDAQICLHGEYTFTHPGTTKHHRNVKSATPLSRVLTLGIYYASCHPYQDLMWPYLLLVSTTLNSRGKGRRICSTTPYSRKEVKHLGCHMQSLQHHGDKTHRNRVHVCYCT